MELLRVLNRTLAMMDDETIETARTDVEKYTSASGTECGIRKAVAADRRKGGTVLSEEVVAFVKQNIPSDWPVRRNVSRVKTVPMPSNMVITVPGNYELFIEASPNPAFFCLVASRYYNASLGNSSTSRAVVELCTKHILLDTIRNVNSYIQKWYTVTVSLLRDSGVPIYNPGQLAFKVSDVIIVFVPSFFNTCKMCMIFRQYSLESGKKNHIPDWEVNYREELRLMLLTLNTNPDLETFSMGEAKLRFPSQTTRELIEFLNNDADNEEYSRRPPSHGRGV
jgi:hypothetical protein